MPKSSVTCVKPADPPFLKKLKERVGYKEGPTVNTKREELPQDTDDRDVDLNEEKPVVVVLNEGDLTAEEAEAFSQDREDDKPQGGKILFKKPIKRTAEEENVNSSTSKAKKLKDAVVVNREKVSSVKDSRLLSFDQDEDEED